MIYTDLFIIRLLFLRCLCRVAPKSFILSWMVASICWFKLVQLLGATMYTSKLTSSKLRFVNLRASFYWVIHWTLFFNLFYMSMWYSVTVPTLFFSRPRSEGWPHHGRTFSIYPCPLSFWLTLPRRVLSTSW